MQKKKNQKRKNDLYLEKIRKERKEKWEEFGEG